MESGHVKDWLGDTCSGGMVTTAHGVGPSREHGLMLLWAEQKQQDLETSCVFLYSLIYAGHILHGWIEGAISNQMAQGP